MSTDISNVNNASTKGRHCNEAAFTLRNTCTLSIYLSSTRDGKNALGWSGKFWEIAQDDVFVLSLNNVVLHAHTVEVAYDG